MHNHKHLFLCSMHQIFRAKKSIFQKLSFTAFYKKFQKIRDKYGNMWYNKYADFIRQQIHPKWSDFYVKKNLLHYHTYLLPLG